MMKKILDALFARIGYVRANPAPTWTVTPFDGGTCYVYGYGAQTSNSGH